MRARHRPGGKSRRLRLQPQRTRVWPDFDTRRRPAPAAADRSATPRRARAPWAFSTARWRGRRTAHWDRPSPCQRLPAAKYPATRSHHAVAHAHPGAADCRQSAIGPRSPPAMPCPRFELAQVQEAGYVPRRRKEPAPATDRTRSAGHRRTWRWWPTTSPRPSMGDRARANPTPCRPGSMPSW